SPCSLGFLVSGRSTSGPFRICGAMTMKMISSTSTTSTSGVMLMAAFILEGSPSRMGNLWHLDARRRRVTHLELPELDLGDLEQAVHELRRHAVHLDVEVRDLARDVVESDHCRDGDEDAQGGRDRRL